MAIYIQPGLAFEADAVNLLPDAEGTIGVTIKDAPAGGTVVVARTTSGITEDPAGSGHYGKSDFEAPEDGGQYWLFWDSGVDTAPFASEELRVAYTNPDLITGPTFANPWDVEARLGRELTTAEAMQVDYLLAAGTDAILDAIGKDADWAVGPNVPTFLRFFLTDLVVRSLSAPVGTDSTTESLGEYSFTNRYSDSGGGLWLTAAERKWLRGRFGYSSGSVRIESIVHDFIASDS